MKRILLPLFILFLVFVQASPLEAAAKPKKAAGQAISVSAKYIKPPKNIVRAYFGNLKGVKKITYTLTYQGNGMMQGVEGSFSPGKKSSYSKDLYLGTCSSRVCTKKTNIKNIQLEITTKFTNGKSYFKKLKVR